MWRGLDGRIVLGGSQFTISFQHSPFLGFILRLDEVYKEEGLEHRVTRTQPVYFEFSGRESVSWKKKLLSVKLKVLVLVKGLLCVCIPVCSISLLVLRS